MERAQEYLTQLEYDLDKLQIRLGLSTMRRHRAKYASPMHQTHVEQSLRMIAGMKREITITSEFIKTKKDIQAIIDSGVKGWLETPEWESYHAAEINIVRAGLSVKLGIEFANVWD